MHNHNNIIINLVKLTHQFVSSYPVCHITQKINFILSWTGFEVSSCIYISDMIPGEKMINYHCLDSSLLLPLATHYSIVFFENMYSLHVELSYYRSKVSIKSEMIQFPRSIQIWNFLSRFQSISRRVHQLLYLCSICIAPTTQGSCLEVAAWEQTELLLVA